MLTIGRRRLIAAVAMAALLISGWWLWPFMPLPAASLTSIAVLPFDDLSPEGDHDWLANGMAEDLIDALNRIEGVRVPARRSSAILKSQDADLPTIGERLAVGTVVEGSVQRVGNQLRVLVRWVRIDDRSQLWSAEYDREYEDVLAIQKELAIGIAEAIRVELDIQDAPASILAHRYQTADVRAWELYKRASLLSLTLDPPKLAQAREMLLRAIEYDPGFVEARVRLSINVYKGDSDGIEAGVEGLKSALEMDPYNAAALSMLAWDSAMRFWDFETAERLLARIPERERTAESLGVAFQVYSLTGHLDEALRAADQAVRLDPMWAGAYCNAARVHELKGEIASAMVAYERGVSVGRETGQFIFACEYYYAVLSSRRQRTPDVKAAGARLVESMKQRDLHIRYDAPCNPDAFATTAEELDQMYDCLLLVFRITDLDVPVRGYRQTILRHAHAATRVVPLFMPHHEEPRFRAHLKRLDDRMALAAGTYEQKVGLKVLPPPN